MDDIRSWWEVPCVAHFCHIFQKPFKLPDFEIEEFEDALLLDCFPSPSKLMVEIFCRFLDGIIDTEINEGNWPLMLKLHLKWRCEHLKEKWNPLAGDKDYKDLDMYSRVSIMHKLCHWRLELDDIGDLLRGLDGPSLRLDPVGKDMDGNTYWYFYGTRLYKEEGKKRKNKKKETSEDGTPAKAKQQQRGGKKSKPNTPASQKATLASKRGRTKQVIQENATPTGRRRGRVNRREEGEEGDGEDDVEESESRDMEDAESKSSRQEESEQGEDEVEEEGSEKKENVCGNGLSAGTGWSVACTTVEEWNQVVNSLKGTKHAETKRLLRALQDFIPEVEHMYVMQERRLKKRALADLPRRTSDRIAIKAAIKEEEERLEAMERELRREELRKLDAEEEEAKEKEAELKRQKRMEEALQRRKAREEQQQKQRMEEESNWEKAMSGELKGRRKAAIGAAENVSEVQRLAEDFLMTDKDFDLYTAMHKILAGLRKHEEYWVFEEPVTEAIAPGYFEVVDKPMDYQTVEKKVEEQVYKTKDEFVTDIELIYDNCCDYNGEESEYFELAEEVRKMFRNLVGVHFEGKSSSEEKPEGKGKKGHRRESRSPSACKTPEFTSESSSEEGSEDEGSDDSYTEGVRMKKIKGSKGSELKLHPSMEQRVGSGFHPRFPPPMPHPHHMGHTPPPPHVYHQMMQHYYQQRMPRPSNMPPGPEGYPHRLPPPYPGFHPEMARPPGPAGMYPPPSPSEQHTPPTGMPPPPHQDMMRPMYPYPAPPPNHPAHPAHPHHAAYRQHLYEMQYHGMDPRMMGMRPPGMGMRPGGLRPRPGLPGLKFNFQGMRPLHAHHSDKSRRTGSPASQVRDKCSESGEDEVEGKPSMQQGPKKEAGISEGNASEEESKTEEAAAGVKQQPQASDEDEIESTGRMDTEEKAENKEKVESKEIAGNKEKVESNEIAEKKDHSKETPDNKKRTENKEDASAMETRKEKETGEIDAQSRTENSAKSNSTEDTTSGVKKARAGFHMTPEQMEKFRLHQHMMALHQHREAMSRGAYPFPPPPPGSGPPQSEEAAVAAAAAYYGHHYPPPQHPHAGYSPGMPDPRQMELAAQQHQYWMEMEAKRRRYMMKQAQQSHHAKRQKQQQQQQQQQAQPPPQPREGGNKERSAETGQEGLEDVPDYQDSLRQYALGLADEEQKACDDQREGSGGEGEGSGKGKEESSSPSQNKVKSQQPNTSNHDQSKQQRELPPSGIPPYHLPHPGSGPGPGPPMMPNGYPVPPYPPTTCLPTLHTTCPLR